MKRERVNITTIIYHLPMTSPVAHGNPMIKTTTKKTSFNPAFLMPCQDTKTNKSLQSTVNNYVKIRSTIFFKHFKILMRYRSHNTS